MWNANKCNAFMRRKGYGNELQDYESKKANLAALIEKGKKEKRVWDGLLPELLPGEVRQAQRETEAASVKLTQLFNIEMARLAARNEIEKEDSELDTHIAKEEAFAKQRAELVESGVKDPEQYQEAVQNYQQHSSSLNFKKMAAAKGALPSGGFNQALHDAELNQLRGMRTVEQNMRAEAAKAHQEREDKELAHLDRLLKDNPSEAHILGVKRQTILDARARRAEEAETDQEMARVAAERGE